VKARQGVGAGKQALIYMHPNLRSDILVRVSYDDKRCILALCFSQKSIEKFEEKTKAGEDIRIGEISTVYLLASISYLRSL
jgi:hypothetical protein